MKDGKPAKERKPATRTPKSVLRSPLFKIAVAVVLFLLIGTSAVVLHYYNYYSQIIDRRLNGEVFQRTARIYATPYRVYAGQKITPDDVVNRLQRAGFEPDGAANVTEGVYEASAERVTIRPAVGDVLRLDFGKDSKSITRIVKPGIATVTEAPLPAELVTNLFDEDRQKRRVVEFSELPPNLVNALIASEDRRFYSHWGFDPVRIVGGITSAVRKSSRVQAVSTITQQLARNFFLTPDRSLRRKLAEVFIAVILEQRLTKQQILTMYANEVFLGQRGSFGIRGYSEAAAAYFNKDLTGLTLSEAAMLVGINPAPNTYSPSKYPDRAKKRRDVVLGSMRQVGSINEQEYQSALKEEIKVAPIKIDAGDAPYMVDFVREELLKDFSEDQLINESLRVYSTLDPELQRAAVDALQKGLKAVEEQLAARDKGKKNPPARPRAQAAMIALDPHTGEIKAMVGGSDYGLSQLNRITSAFRQPGSIFKPFVYAAAFEASEQRPFTGPQGDDASAEPAPANDPQNAIAADASADPADPSFSLATGEAEGLITPITVLRDEPTTFVYDNGKLYEPNNYKEEYRGTVTVRQALQHSLNVPTIRVAERVGFDRVANLARRAGLNEKIKGYPSIALGAFEVTPLEMAGAYTVFANEGKRVQPHALVRVVEADGSLAKSYKYEPRQVLSPQVTYLMTNLLQGVVNAGTGVRVRSMGFTLPAAGKTGTSRDGWFAGYTKDFLAIAWVGFDDNRDLNLEGSRSALPIWTDFMLKATTLYPPRDPDSKYFSAPEDGLEFVSIDRESNMPATTNCIDVFDEVFLAGTVPSEYCPIHSVTISQTIENGVVQAGKGVGNVFKGIGRVIGGIFGGGDDDDEKSKDPKR